MTKKAIPEPSPAIRRRNISLTLESYIDRVRLSYPGHERMISEILEDQRVRGYEIHRKKTSNDPHELL
jgi:hypothetical protein